MHDEHRALMGIGSAGRTAKGDVSHRQFWLNESGPAGAYGVRHVYAPVEKVDCHVEDRGSGLTHVNLSEAIPMGDSSYRSYATVRTADQRTMGIGIWESQDALNWSPRRLGQVKHEAHDTNLVHFEDLPGDQTVPR